VKSSPATVMRIASECGTTDVPRWSLWLVALVSFAPVAALWLLGVLYSLFWTAVLAVGVTPPERLQGPLLDEISGVIGSIGLVIAGFIGLVGLLRVLTLPRREPKTHRFFTIAAVAVGLTGLAIFDLPFLLDAASGFSDGIPVMPIALYLVLPFTGGAWILAKSRKFLFAGKAAVAPMMRRATVTMPAPEPVAMNRGEE